VTRLGYHRAPEVLFGTRLPTNDTRDVFAIGVTLYELVRFLSPHKSGSGCGTPRARARLGPAAQGCSQRQLPHASAASLAAPSQPPEPDQATLCGSGTQATEAAEIEPSTEGEGAIRSPSDPYVWERKLCAAVVWPPKSRFLFMVFSRRLIQIES
jgi:hypothetical protein